MDVEESVIFPCDRRHMAETSMQFAFSHIVDLRVYIVVRDTVHMFAATHVAVYTRRELQRVLTVTVHE